MAARQPQRPRPAGRSKTNLRRGQFTPGIASPKKTAPPRGGSGTTRAEEALLFGEPLEEHDVNAHTEESSVGSVPLTPRNVVTSRTKE
jgi:hypothetical protein